MTTITNSHEDLQKKIKKEYFYQFKITGKYLAHDVKDSWILSKPHLHLFMPVVNPKNFRPGRPWVTSISFWWRSWQNLKSGNGLGTLKSSTRKLTSTLKPYNDKISSPTRKARVYVTTMLNYNMTTTKSLKKWFYCIITIIKINIYPFYRRIRQMKISLTDLFLYTNVSIKHLCQDLFVIQ